MGLLAEALKQKRGDMPLRDAQAESGIHYATLHRMEHGKGSSLTSVFLALTWLGIPQSKWGPYLKPATRKRRS